MKVMNVDDSATMRKIVIMALRDIGFEVIEAENGKDGLAKLNPEIKLFIVDINMPEMNGLEFIGEIKKMPAYAKVPIIILTTEKEEELKQKGLALGANAWFIKPFDPVDFKNLVKKTVGQ